MMLKWSFFAPFIYLALGLIIGRIWPNVKDPVSALLTRVAIPILIVTQLLGRPSGMVSVMLTMIATMTFLMAVSRAITTDPVRNLAFCYLNIGWLGLPIATALFGDDASKIVLAAYIGSSIFGNSISVGLLMQRAGAGKRLLRMFISPPVLAVVMGLALQPFAESLQTLKLLLEPVLKLTVSLSGMLVLGIWLSNARWRLADLKLSLTEYSSRAVIVSSWMAAIAVYGTHHQIPLITENLGVMGLLPILPPAANIIVLETHYCQTGRSAGLIAWETLISVIAIGIFSSLIHSGGLSGG